MNFEVYNFRNALSILEGRPEWDELRKVIESIGRDDIIEEQQELLATRSKPPAGAQTAANAVFEHRLMEPSWTHQCRLFETRRDAGRWTMDFLKRGVASPYSEASSFGLGVEVAFNHAEAIAWTLVRLNLASEASNVREDARIDVGVAIFATQALKRWGRMDGAVGTFEQARRWLGLMKAVMPTPIVLVGLDPRDREGAQDWAATDVFRGTRSGT